MKNGNRTHRCSSICSMTSIAAPRNFWTLLFDHMVFRLERNASDGNCNGPPCGDSRYLRTRRVRLNMTKKLCECEDTIVINGGAYNRKRDRVLRRQRARFATVGEANHHRVRRELCGVQLGAGVRHASAGFGVAARAVEVSGRPKVLQLSLALRFVVAARMLVRVEPISNLKHNCREKAER